MRFSISTRPLLALFIGTVLFGVGPVVSAGVFDAIKPPELPELPSFEAKMPTPGQSAAAQVSCLQQGTMDMSRPSLPLLSCWESPLSSGESMEELQKACTVQMTPMKIDSTLVPKCPPKALGTCIGAKSGKDSVSDHYHYTPQTLSEWIKSKKNCEKAGGKWYGLGNPTSWF